MNLLWGQLSCTKFSGEYDSPGVAELYCLMAIPITMNQLDRIEEKLDKLLNILGAEGSGRLPSEIKREALSKVFELSLKRERRKHERETKGSK